MKGEVKISLAVLDGKVVHVNEVDRGIACRCTCPKCQEPLVARQGPTLSWHFAHAAETSCATAPETGLHMLAKQILCEQQKVRLPSAYITVKSGYVYEVLSAHELVFDEIVSERECERLYPGLTKEMVPDLVGRVGQRLIFIEIAVAHPIDQDKMEKIKNLGVDTVEIDLKKVSREITAERLVPILLDELPRKVWKYHSEVERQRVHFEQVDRERREKIQKRLDEQYKEMQRREEAIARINEVNRQKAEARALEQQQQREERRKAEEQERQDRAKREAEESARIKMEWEEIERKRAEEEERMRPIREAQEKERQKIREQQDRQRAEERAERARQEAIERAEQERVAAIEKARIDTAKEAAYQKRREYDLQMWSQAEQMKYRDLCDKEGMTHVQATAAVSEIHRATADERAAEYDRTHRPRFKFNAVTGRGGYV